MPTPAQLAADAEAEITPGAAVPGLADLVTRMAAMRASLDDLEAQQKALQREYDDVRKNRIPATMAAAGVTSAKFLAGTLSLRSKSYASVSKGRRMDALVWVWEQGFDEVLKIDGAALRGLVEELVEGGQPVPDFVQLYTEEMAVLTAPRGAKSNE